MYDGQRDTPSGTPRQKRSAAAGIAFWCVHAPPHSHGGASGRRWLPTTWSCGRKGGILQEIPQIRSHAPQLAFQRRVLPCNTHEMRSCVPERLHCIHHNHEKPNPVGEKSSAGKIAAEASDGSCARRFLDIGGGGGGGRRCTHLTLVLAGGSTA